MSPGSQCSQQTTCSSSTSSISSGSGGINNPDNANYMKMIELLMQQDAVDRAMHFIPRITKKYISN